MHEEKGVKFYPSVGVEKLLSANGKNAVSHVVLTDGTKIEADVVVVGTGKTTMKNRVSKYILTQRFTFVISWYFLVL